MLLPVDPACVDVVLTSSPIRSNPSIAMVQQVIESLAHLPGISQCPLTLVFDGYTLAEEEAHKSGRITAESAERYHAYVAATKTWVVGHYPRAQHAVTRSMAFHFTRHEARPFRLTEYYASLAEADAALPPPPIQQLQRFYAAHPTHASMEIETTVPLPQRRPRAVVRFIEAAPFDAGRIGFAWAVKLGMWFAQSPYILQLQHDWEFIAPIDIHGLVSCMERHSEAVQYIAFMGKRSLSYADRIAPARGLPPADAMPDYGVPLRRLFFFYDRNHLMRTARYYRIMVHASGAAFKFSRGDFIEDTYGQAMTAQCRRSGATMEERLAVHDQYGVFLNYPHDGAEQQLRHLHGRKFMTEAERDRAIRYALEQQAERTSSPKPRSRSVSSSVSDASSASKQA
ncbi:hypothetical protein CAUPRSCDRAFT_10314 [Caulochytrium protostelioides]|nr:hypothetical protein CAUPRSCDRAFT_10314 [Caulochytrium protostelioides]